MMYSQIRQCVLIGAGNVSTQLAGHLHRINFSLVQIWSRTEHSARALSELTGTPYCTDIRDLRTNADIYMLAVPDDALPEILPKLTLPTDRFLVHTSGSTPLKVLSPFTERPGVFYPVQTLSKEHYTDFKQVPVCIEAGHATDLALLREFTEHFTGKIYEIDSEKRRIVHLAAIFASNFTNYLYRVSDELLRKIGLPFDLVKPIIEETAAKVQQFDPHLLQTGPAQRKDLKTISGHMEWLGNRKQFQELYALITRCILEADDQSIK
jgi:predicted short-subunit dehydrogenase-like oxidoreductase (DUF2520 family)